MLGGGLAPASLTVVRPGGSARLEDFRSWTMPLVRGALAGGRGALITLATGEDPWTLWEAIVRQTGGSAADRVRLIDYASDTPRGPWHVPLHPELSRYITVPRMAHAERAVRGPMGGSVVELWDFEPLEGVVGPHPVAGLVRTATRRLRENGNWAVLWAPHAGPMLTAARAAARLELVLARDGGGLAVSGARPAFPGVFVAP